MTREQDAHALHTDALTRAAAGDLRQGVTLLQAALACGTGPQTARRADLAALHAARREWSAATDVLEPVLAELAGPGIAVYLVAAVATGTSGSALARLNAVDNQNWAHDVDAVAEYGRACLDAGRHADAERALLWCLEQQPSLGRARNALAHLYFETGRGDLAATQWHELGAGPEATVRHRVDCAMGLLKTGLVDEAREARRRAEACPLSGDNLASVLYLHLFDQDATGPSVRDASAARGRAPAGWVRRRSSRRDERLRIGFLSGEFASRPATYFLDPLLEGLDRDRCVVVRYNTLVEYETRRPSTHADDAWRTLPGPDDEAAAVIADDELDVLIDLAGCFPGQRRDVLMLGPAPVQAAYPNYPGTTGVAAIQWFLTDRWLSPPGTENGYSERLYRLQGGALRYKPPTTPPVALRGDTGRPLTFGFFQRAIKCSQATWELLAGVLRAVPGARLLVHSGDSDLDVDESALRRRWTRQMDSRDVDPTRLTFVGPRRLDEHLQIVGSVDIALDSYPFSGQTTAMECLWMGVPIISRLGSLHASRVSGALMAQVGLDALVSDDGQAYVQRAAALAGDRARLHRIQHELRGRMIDAGLTDGLTLAAEVEAACRAWATEPLAGSLRQIGERTGSA